MRRSLRHAYPLSCMLIDIDNFADINDNWGHPVGDGVLRDVAHIVTRTMRSTDIVCRYRDDEFLVLLTDTDATGSANRRQPDARAGHGSPLILNRNSGDPVKLTASTGVAYWEPADKKNATWEPVNSSLSPSAPSAPPRCPAPIAWLCCRPHKSLSISRSISCSCVGSASNSISAIFLPLIVNLNTTRGCPPGAHTAPTAASTSASRAALARPEKVSATAIAPSTSFCAPVSTAARSALSTTFSSSNESSALKSPLREAERKASTTSRWRV